MAFEKSKMIGTEIRLMISRRESGRRLIRSEGVMEMFYVLIVMAITQLSIVHTSSKGEFYFM